MKTLKNKYGIKKIRYKGNYNGYCTLGKEYFECEVNIGMDCKDVIPEYCSMEKDITEIISNEYGVTLESCTRSIHELFKKHGINTCVTVKSLSGAHQSVEVEYYE